MFDDKSIDIQTGALLGRYIAEERDSGRLLTSCYRQLCAAENGSSVTNGDGADLSAQLEPNRGPAGAARRQEARATR